MVLANVARSMEELIGINYRSKVAALLVGPNASLNGLWGLLVPGACPIHVVAVVTHFKTIMEGNDESDCVDAQVSTLLLSTASIQLWFCDTLKVQIHNQLETVKVTAPVEFSGWFGLHSSSSRNNHLQEAFNLDFDCVHLLDSMIDWAWEASPQSNYKTTHDCIGQNHTVLLSLQTVLVSLLFFFCNAIFIVLWAVEQLVFHCQSVDVVQDWWKARPKKQHWQNSPTT